MGLASALTTALTGLTAAETQIDVVGNNLANSQTVGFKASETMFSTQFLQTQGLGSAPTANTGGTNPRQTGLGTQVAEITPDFTQGTIEVSSNPSDLAIQGNGFFIVEGSSGEQLYTRNGIFKTNSENQLVTVNGNRLLGYGVDDVFALQSTELRSLEIPLGATQVAQATRNVVMEGTLTPSGDVANTAEILESAVLGDAAVPRPDASGATVGIAGRPESGDTTIANNKGAGSHPENVTYRYRFTYAYGSGDGMETLPSQEVAITVPVSNGVPDNALLLDSLPDSSIYDQLNVYRTEADGDDFYFLTSQATANAGGPTQFLDDNSIALDLGSELNEDTINGNYSYLVTFSKDGEVESRPSALLGPQSVVDGRVRLSGLPTPPVPGVEDSFPAYDSVRVYRNVVGDSSSFYLLTTLDPGEAYVDAISDTEIQTNQPLDLDGPKANPNTLLTNVLVRDELAYEQIFEEGVLSLSARKGGRGLATKDFEITETTTLQELIDFMEDATGIQQAADDPTNPIPASLNSVDGGSDGQLAPGASVLANGKIRFVSNNGEDNAVAVGLSAFTLESDGNVLNPSLGFGTVQEAVGRSTVADFLVYDTLGSPLSVRVTTVLEERTGSQTVYRWFADSPDNDPLDGSEISVGTGLIRFDGEGNLISTSNDTISIDRRNTPAASPLEFDLDFSALSGLAAETSTLAAARQDGSAPGTLTSFTIGEDGIIRGSFNNGVSRTLGQIRMVRFTNPTGLEQRGQNLFSTGSNSGLPVQGNPGENGIGSIIAGAVELSNTDTGQNLIDLVLATTQYRGNTRVITTAQQLIDELLNLRR